MCTDSDANIAITDHELNSAPHLLITISDPFIYFVQVMTGEWRKVGSLQEASVIKISWRSEGHKRVRLFQILKKRAFKELLEATLGRCREDISLGINYGKCFFSRSCSSKCLRPSKPKCMPY